MVVESTSEIKTDGNLVMVIYGKGGVGKTTFAASAPDCLILDFENGTKYLGERGFDVKVVRFNSWPSNAEKARLADIIKPFRTVVVDPLGEAMEKLLNGNTLSGSKFRQNDGSLTMAGWGEAKKQMRGFIKWLRDSGKNVILVAHESEEKDRETIVHRIQLTTKLREEIPNIVDVISYMGVKMVEEKPVRLLYTPRQGDEFDSKDRTGRVPLTVEIGEKSGFRDFLDSMGVLLHEPEKPSSEKENKKGKSASRDVVAEILKEAADLINANKGLFEAYELVGLREEYEKAGCKNEAIALKEKILQKIDEKNTRFEEDVPFEEPLGFEDDPVPEPSKKSAKPLPIF